MTRDQAIEQLDWYFDSDDGGAADPVTKEAYQTLKTIVMTYPVISPTALCPNCSSLVVWNSYFSRYICSKCGWEGAIESI